MAVPPINRRTTASAETALPRDADQAPGRTASGEGDLVERLLAGDEAAFDSLVAQHHGAMMRFARCFLSRSDVAEEIVQETWLAVLKGLSAFERRSSLKTWIFQILANRARSRATREGRVIPFADVAPDDERDTSEELPFTAGGSWGVPPAPWQVDTPEAVMLRREAVEQIERAMEALPSAQRTVVTLRDVEGLDAAQVCNILQITETNQRVLLHRARSRLRKALDGVLGHRA
jgi:RNA polymerase sigma-70 factor (ECF subfamily)